MRSLEKLYTPTPLYGLKLLRTAQGDPESLFSYMLRLALAHRVTPNHLFHKFILWRHHSRTGFRMRLGSLLDDGIRLLGPTAAAKRFCDEFTELTGVQGMESGTALPLSQFCALQEFTTPSNRVCLACIREDLATVGKTFGRLLWRITCVECCPIHEDRLVDVRGCTSAQATCKGAKPMKLYGVCPSCASIGYQCLTCTEKGTPEELATAKLCRELLVAAPTLPSTSQDSKTAFREHVSKMPGGYAEVARKVDVNKSIIARWLNDPEARMTLPVIIRISKVLDVTAVQFARGELDQAGGDSANLSTRKKRVLRRHDQAALKSALKDALASDTETVEDVLRKCRVDYRCLRRVEPEMHGELVRRRKAQRAELRRQRWEIAYQRAEAMAMTFRALGRKATLGAASALDNSNWKPNRLHSRVLYALAFGDVERAIRRSFMPHEIAERCRAYVREQEASAALKTPTATSRVDA